MNIEPHPQEDLSLPHDTLVERILQGIQPGSLLDTRGINQGQPIPLDQPFERASYDLILCGANLEDLSPAAAEAAVANLCRHCRAVLFVPASAAPTEPLRAVVPENAGPEFWGLLFLRQGFVHDVESLSFLLAAERPLLATGDLPPLLFRQASPQPPARSPEEQALTSYERLLWQLSQENSIRRSLNITQRQELMQKETARQKELAHLRHEMAGQNKELADLRGFLEVRLAQKNAIIAARDMEIESWQQAVNAAHAERDAILNSTSWRLMVRLQRLRERAVPIGSRREALVGAAWARLRQAGRAILPKPRTAPTLPAVENQAAPATVPPGIETITVPETVDLLPPAQDAYHAERQEWQQRGAQHFAGKRLLFILPVAAAGGGANLVLLAARAMRRMGVDAQVYNLSPYRRDFERAYPDLDVPVAYGEIEDLPETAMRYDAAVASSYITVYWLAPLVAIKPELPLGYFIQDYEPYFEETGSESYQKAAASYTLFPKLIRCCTTRWIDAEIQRMHSRQHGGTGERLPMEIIGPSLDTDLFWARRSAPQDQASAASPAPRPLRIAAMIRPSTPRRSPRLTMQLLQRASQEFGDLIEPLIFGAHLTELQQAASGVGSSMPLDFPFKLAGRLTQQQVAALMGETDIFVDFSVFQGLGLSALEAMACGAAAVVPERGGTGDFARHEQNCLVVDTQDSQACYAALQRLITDHALRQTLQQNGRLLTPQFYPEQPAFKMLQALWRQGQEG